MTPAELAAIRERADAQVAVSSWSPEAYSRETVLAVCHMTASLIAALEVRRADVRALLAEVERLRGADVRCAECEKEVRDLRAKIERLW